MRVDQTPLDGLLKQLEQAHDAPLRHLWLRDVLDWLRGREGRVPDVLARMDALLKRLQACPRNKVPALLAQSAAPVAGVRRGR